LILYVSGKSPHRISFDYIELVDKNGKVLNLTCDEQDFGYENGEFDIRMKGVEINGKYANGQLERIRNFDKISDFQVYDYVADTELLMSDGEVKLSEMSFDDNGRRYRIVFPKS